MTIDQRGSRQNEDRVPQLLTSFADVRTVAGFERTVGDEVQGVLADPAGVIAVLKTVIREGGWHVGVGFGRIDEDVLRSIRTQGVRVGRGAPFVWAREAVEEAKNFPASIIFHGDDDVVAGIAQSFSHLLWLVVAARTEAQREVVDLIDAGLSGRAIAAKLGIAPSSVSARKSLSHIDEENAAWVSLAKILSEANERLEVAGKK